MVTLVLSGAGAPEAGRGLEVLTPREDQVMRGLAEGRTNHEIAHDLEINVKTVDTHRGHILKKLGVRNNSELVRYAIRNNVIVP